MMDRARQLSAGVVGVREELVLRLLAEAESDEAAAVLVAAVQTSLASHAVIEHWDGERYWKQPELFDLELRLRPLTRAADAYAAIIRLTTVWHHFGEDDGQADCEALWNREISPQSQFVHPAIQWAEPKLLRFPLLADVPQFGLGEQVRLSGQTKQATTTAVTNIFIVRQIELRFEGSYLYILDYEQAASNGDEPLHIHWEYELEKACANSLSD
ncbi:MAG: hypothetical protein PHH47_10980 [Gallionella sp.]|nr:hypothetical protein [Gallionella sp.]MDD4946541.1 hypothetical protein [Gallionella sp.]